MYMGNHLYLSSFIEINESNEVRNCKINGYTIKF